MIQPQTTTLSTNAYHLWEYLSAHCLAREHAATDRQIAAATCLAEREIVDLADELTNAGYVVIAECAPPHGRWLLPRDATADQLAAARRYANSLGRRGVAVLRRRKHLRAAIAAEELRRPIQSDGQMTLPGLAGALTKPSRGW